MRITPHIAQPSSGVFETKARMPAIQSKTAIRWVSWSVNLNSKARRRGLGSSFNKTKLTIALLAGVITSIGLAVAGGILKQPLAVFPVVATILGTIVPSTIYYENSDTADKTKKVATRWENFLVEKNLT